MRYHVEGFLSQSTAPAGSFLAVHHLLFTHPTTVTEIEATFTLDALTLHPCAVNNAGFVTRAAPAIALDAADAILPFVQILQVHRVANCHDARAVIKSTARVGRVLTNPAAVIP